MGEEVFLYVGSPNTIGHGEVFVEPPVYPGPPSALPPWRPPLSPPTGGISLLRVRKHGFVAVEGPSRPLLPLANTTGCRPKDYPSAAGPSELYPGFTTVALETPDNCSGHLVLAVNAKTSVAGFVQIGIVSQANSTDYSRYRLCNSDPLRGNFLAATASWGGGSARTLPSTGRGGSMQLEVILVAAKLFSLQFKCMAPLALKTDDSRPFEQGAWWARLPLKSSNDTLDSSGDRNGTIAAILRTKMTLVGMDAMGCGTAKLPGDTGTGGVGTGPCLCNFSNPNTRCPECPDTGVGIEDLAAFLDVAAIQAPALKIFAVMSSHHAIFQYQLINMATVILV